MSIRVGGITEYRKPGGQVRQGLIEWIYDDGSMRVRPVSIGKRLVIEMADVERAAKPKRRRSVRA